MYSSTRTRPGALSDDRVGMDFFPTGYKVIPRPQMFTPPCISPSSFLEEWPHRTEVIPHTSRAEHMHRS